MNASSPRSITGKRRAKASISTWDCSIAKSHGSSIKHGLSDDRRCSPAHWETAIRNIVPYRHFYASDGEFIIACGNDQQFSRLVEGGGRPELATDPRFTKNVDRVKTGTFSFRFNHDMTRTKTKAEWIDLLDKVSVPGGPVNNMQEAF
jgi:crotonobetainyl-CoA:carnitine CoA-transferase CaiB-like acyl-CoA transferase